MQERPCTVHWGIRQKPTGQSIGVMLQIDTFTKQQENISTCRDTEFQTWKSLMWKK